MINTNDASFHKKHCYRAMYCSLILFLLIYTHTHLLDRLHGWWRVLVAAQIDHDPGDIAEEGDGDGGTDERKQGLDHTQADHIVSALRAITWREHTKIKQMSSWDWLHFLIHLFDTNYNLPMMLPRAHTACSQTFWWGEWSSLRKSGTASTQRKQNGVNLHHHQSKTMLIIWTQASRSGLH